MISAELLINVTPREVRIALLENGSLQEVFIERLRKQVLIGNIYKGKITRILPGIQSAFVDIGLERAGFLHRNDITSDETIDIRDKLRAGQELLVQVYKDPLGSKGARLTTQITLPSRYLVLTPGNDQVNVSQKIEDEAERLRLQTLLSPDPEGGYIFRTAAEGITDADIESEKKFLADQWREIKARAEKTKACAIVYEDLPAALRILRDTVHTEITKIRVDDLSTYEQMRSFAEATIPRLLNVIEYYSEPRPIFDIHSVESEIQKALERKVNLKSGGYLVFDQTEAMTTIDINTGSFIGRNDLEQTIFKTNLEAAEVIARQIRLRNLGGIIIIDFIDMQNTAHREHLLQALLDALNKDKARLEVSEISSLGLVQLTRKRTRESLENTLCVTCPCCHHRGTIKSLETVSYDIFRELQRSALIFPWEGFLVLASEAIIDYLIDIESAMIAQLEQKLGKKIKLQVESTYMQEHYDVLPLKD